MESARAVGESWRSRYFLMPSHLPSADGRFLCKLQDMMALKGEDGGRGQPLRLPDSDAAAEVSGGRRGKQGPELGQLVSIARKYDVSKEAAGRAYVRFRDEPVALIVTQNDKVVRDYYDPIKYPRLAAPRGRLVPDNSLLRRRKHESGVPSAIDETDAGVWMDLERGRQPQALYEQVLLQQQGFALIMLSKDAAAADEDDEEAEMTAAQRLKRRLR